jgi:hypothetical protein
MSSLNILLLLVVFLSFTASLNAFKIKTYSRASSIKLQNSVLDNYAFNVAELFSGPAAKYNGELIDKSLKLVERVPKPPGYEYGAVSADSLAPLIGSLVLVLGFAAFVPYFLAIGETALKQQRDREAEDGISGNEFARKAKILKDAKK